MVRGISRCRDRAESFDLTLHLPLYYAEPTFCAMVASPHPRPWDECINLVEPAVIISRTIAKEAAHSIKICHPIDLIQEWHGELKIRAERGP